MKIIEFVGAGSFLICLTIAGTSAVLAKGHEGAGNSWQWQLQAGGYHQSSSDIDSGGEVSVNTAYAGLSTSRRLGNSRISLALGYGEDDYDFSGSAGLAGLSPWNRIRQLSLSASIFHNINNNWTIYGIPSLRYNSEQGAALEDGQTVGLLAGASYRFSNSLTLGPGMGAFSEIEDNSSFFPILIIDWKITPSLSLETGRGFAASRGPGLQLRWRYSPQWQFIAGGRYEKKRFRLKHQQTVNGGVGEHTSIPLFVMLQYSLTPQLTVNLTTGMTADTTMRLEDANNNIVSESDLDAAAFIGAAFRLRF